MPTFTNISFEQGTRSFDDPTIGFDDPAVFFDEIGPTTRTLTGGSTRGATLVSGWLRTAGAWLGLRPFTMKTSCQKAEPQRRREGPMSAVARLVRDH